MKRLALIGSKEFAEQIHGFAETTGDFNVVGYFDDFEPKGKLIRSLPVLGEIDDIEEEYQNKTFDCIFFAAGYNNFNFRETVFNRLFGHVPFANIIMPTAEVSPSARLGEGNYVGPHTTIAANTVIENNVFIHGHCLIGHDSIVHSHSYFSGRDYMAGFCEVGERVFVGLSVCVADHMTITNDVWIGIGSIVAKDLKESGKYMSASTRLVRVE